MGERQVFQSLTREDKITVVLYRAGIVLSAVIVAGPAFLLATGYSLFSTTRISPATDVLIYGLYASAGMSVFFIHLYVSRFKIYLKNLYFISLGCLVVLLFIGGGSLSGCLGFVTAKEAFCFQLFEGYLLAMIMPLYLVLVSAGILIGQGASYGLVLIAVMLVIFTLRKVFMPIAFDIGDKSAYR